MRKGVKTLLANTAQVDYKARRKKKKKKEQHKTVDRNIIFLPENTPNNSA